MKPLVSHAAASAVGMGVGIALIAFLDRDEKHEVSGDGRIHLPSQPSRATSSNSGSDRGRPGREKASLDLLAVPDSAALIRWLDTFGGDARTMAEAQATVGMLTGDPDLVRKAIASDPSNPFLLFMGSTFHKMPEDERLDLARRAAGADPENAAAAYVLAERLFAAGDPKEALRLLTEAAELPKMDDFRAKAAFLAEEALVGAGTHGTTAKLSSSLRAAYPFGSELIGLADSVNSSRGSMSPEESSVAAAAIASMGRRIGDRADSGFIMDRLYGLKLQKATLAGLPDDSPSAYQGFTIAEAKAYLEAESHRLKEEFARLPDLPQVMASHPELMGGYSDRLRTLGELEAMRWLTQRTGETQK
jgi:tetratricopeptide (TPR) repeat protein